MRKNYIGQTVKVKIDEIKNIKSKDDQEIQITNGSVSLNGVPIGASLL